jgi:hypothetical protein
MNPLEKRFATPVSGPSYRVAAKVTVLATIVGIAVVAARTADQLTGMTWPMMVLLATVFLGMVVTGWYVLTGRTTIDAQGIHQDWMAPKHYTWDQIARARRIRLLVTSRLLISTGNGPMKSIHGGSPELDAAFADIVAYYRGMPLATPQ